MRQLAVTVIIAAYNEEKNIRSCLASLFKQDYKPQEIIVVNDGSTDKTEEYLKNPSVQYYTISHRGTAVARNFAAQRAQGDILVFLDADMEFEPNFISQLVRPINEGKAQGTFSKLEYVKNWDQPLARCWNRITSDLPDKLRISQRRKEGDDFRAILKSEFLRVGGFDNIGYTDTWTLAHKLQYKPVYAPNAIYYHNNPETFSEVFWSTAWIGKRKYKFGILGILLASIRSFFIVSLVKGIIKFMRYHEPLFIPFYLVYDLGVTKGILYSFFFKDVKK